jgi:Ca2+-binding EF-hand superfamily protein
MDIKIDYEHIREVLCLDKTQEGFNKRNKIWRSFDGNGNGILSLAEVDKGIRDVLKLPEVYGLKQVIIRAFQAAKDVCPNTGKLSGDYIERNEFRVFLVFLRQFLEYYEMFSIINSDHDHYIELEEFQAALPKLQNWGVKIENPEETFKEIDTDNGGRIRFDEFCKWAIKHNLDIDTDDDFQDESLKNIK